VLQPDDALAAWDLPRPPRPIPEPGLINQTFLVGDPPVAVLQRLNPVFAPAVNLEIAAVTARLEEAGLQTPRVLPTRDGALWVADGDASWRVLSYIPGRTLHRVPSPAIAHEAGRYVGVFHAALHGWDRRRVAPRRDIHDTPLRMKELREALDGCDGHRLAAPARALGQEILRDWATWDGALDLPERTCHGDLKISNLHFHPDRDEVVCLLDLDTVGPMDLSCELGDAWRSWCNPGGEDDPDAARFDIALFEASARGFLSTAPPLTGPERRALPAGPERICLELAGRFCRDAVLNTYFREDRERYPGLGDHNLHRARCQLVLARSARSARTRCNAIVAVAG
jgi:hypothetical protein